MALTRFAIISASGCGSGVSARASVVGGFAGRLFVFSSLQFGDFLLYLTSDHVFDRLLVWLEFGLHSLHSRCFLCSFFDVPGDFLGGPYRHALKVEVVHEAFCRGDKMICVYAERSFAGLKRTPLGINGSCDVLLFSSASLFILLFILGKGLNGGIQKFELGIPENCIKTFL